MENTQIPIKAAKIKLDFKDSKYATGRRKTSIAKVWLKKGSGKIYVNGKLNSYFSETFQNDKRKYVNLSYNKVKKIFEIDGSSFKRINSKK